jgi:transcriptional regulator with XRE-family HTH domain
MRSLREAVGKTQVDVAEAAQMDQADVSRLERRTDFDDCQMTTLRRYVEALGAKFEIVAAFGDKKIAIAGVDASKGLANLELQQTRPRGKGPAGRLRRRNSR